MANIETPTKKIGFIGLGLIGGSIARAIRKYYPAYHLIAHTRNPETTKHALMDGVIDEAADEIDNRFSDCDYIFLCAPVQTNISYLSALKGMIHEDSIITDVGSVKGDIHRAVTALGMDRQFIGGHPMAGSEKTGYENSRDYLIENAYYVLTPSPSVSDESVSEFESLVRSIKSVPIILRPDEHDYITAYVSHLPHIIASMLVNGMEHLDDDSEHMKTIAAGGFKDITRIASSSPEMWQQICLSNKDMILKVLDYYIESLKSARTLVHSGDEGKLFLLFDSARNYRNSLPSKKQKTENREYVIYCDIYDEAGGIATITTLLAMNGISIKNIGITHNREYEEGVLRIEFYDYDAGMKAAGVLRERNYTVYIRK